MKGRSYMRLTKTRFTFLLVLAKFFMMMIPLCASLWALMEVESLRSQLQKLSDELVQCQYGTLVEEEADGESLEIRQESYNPQLSQHGSPGLVTLAIYTSVRSQFSPTNIPSTTVMV